MKINCLKLVCIGTCLLVMYIISYMFLCRYTMLKDAEPTTECMSLYYFDGDNMYEKKIDYFDQQRIIDELRDLSLRRVRKGCLKKMTVPAYALRLQHKNDKGYYQLTYSNNYWIAENGNVYKASFDFADLYNNVIKQSSGLKYRELDPIDSGICMPHGDILSNYDIRYNRKAEVQDIMGCKDVSLSVLGIFNDKIWIRITNSSKKYFNYGDMFFIQREIDGDWYRIPGDGGVFSGGGHWLVPGEKKIKSYSIEKYGMLGKGHYRFILDNDKVVGEFYK